MSCINVNVLCLNTPLNSMIKKLGGVLINIKKVCETLNITIKNKTKYSKVVINPLLSKLEIRFSIVCSIKDANKYLKITPEEIQWITEDMGVYYDVKANVNWVITVD